MIQNEVYIQVLMPFDCSSKHALHVQEFQTQIASLAFVTCDRVRLEHTSGYMVAVWTKGNTEHPIRMPLERQNIAARPAVPDPCDSIKPG
jgi:hypothetical protein